MAEKHQLYMCSKMLCSDGSVNKNFIYEGDIIAEGKSVVFNEEYPDLRLNCYKHLQQKPNSNKRESDGLFNRHSENRVGQNVFLHFVVLTKCLLLPRERCLLLIC